MFLARRSILVLFVFFNCCTARADEAPLLWKFAAGDEHPYRMIQNMDMIMTPPSGEIKTGVKQQIDMTWRIEAVDEAGAAVVTQRIVRVQMDMEAPGPMEIHYDTASEKAPTGFAAMLAPMFKAMSDSPFKWTMSPRGEISNVEIPPGVGEALKKLSGGAMMGDLTTDKGFKQMMQQQVLILPNPGELQPGHKWSTAAEMENPQFGTISTKMSYTYQGPRTVKGEEFEVFKPQLELQFGEGKGGVFDGHLRAENFGRGSLQQDSGPARIEHTQPGNEYEHRRRRSKRGTEDGADNEITTRRETGDQGIEFSGR